MTSKFERALEREEYYRQQREVNKQHEKEKKKLLKNEDKNESESEEGYGTDDPRVKEPSRCSCSCKKMWKGYKACIEFSIMVRKIYKKNRGHIQCSNVLRILLSGFLPSSAIL
jgi:hypothetical protein